MKFDRLSMIIPNIHYKIIQILEFLILSATIIIFVGNSMYFVSFVATTTTIVGKNKDTNDSKVCVLNFLNVTVGLVYLIIVI